MNGTISSNGEPGWRDNSAPGADSRFTYLDNIQEMLASLVETACEHEKDLNLMRLINYVDLYRFYLKDNNGRGSYHADNTQGLQLVENKVCFESFVSSSLLLKSAAAGASEHYGDEVAAPAPLRLSANDSRLRALGAPARS